VIYRDGSPIRIGDQVLVWQSDELGIVQDVVDTVERAKANWGVEETGVMLSVGETWFFLSTEWLENDPLQFVSHKA
jgi:hypothetical protein